MHVLHTSSIETKRVRTGAEQASLVVVLVAVCVGNHDRGLFPLVAPQAQGPVAAPRHPLPPVDVGHALDGHGGCAKDELTLFRNLPNPARAIVAASHCPLCPQHVDAQHFCL